MTALVETILISLGALLVLMTVLWLVSLLFRDASIIDPFWGVGFVLVAWLTAAWNSVSHTRGVLLITLTTIWGLRLCIFLFIRNMGHGEDRRYRAMRLSQGPSFWWVSLFTVFWLQALLLWWVSLPIQSVMAHETQDPLYWIDAAGGLIWMVGLFFEAVGDWQLGRFKADPANAGRVMDRGLWRYTRHPNYFGDCFIWWGLYLIASTGGGLWTIGSPLLMTLLLLKISGVSLLESTIVDRRPEYAAYQKRTSPFFPWPPKKIP